MASQALATTRSGTDVNPWLVALAVNIAAFMVVLDGTIIAVSLPHIGGNLSATPDEATWAMTSYMVANAIILPMSGWLANHFGRKRVLMASIIGFTASSICCGFAPNLPFLIVFRIIQGLTGGGMQPLSQAIMLEVFPVAERAKAMTVWSTVVIVAPILGPILGGWLTDSYSWRWVFYINIPFGLLALVLTSIFLFDPHYIGRKTERVDYTGMGLLVIGIGAVQIMLDKGQQEDWFASNFIITMAVLAVLGLTAAIIHELHTPHPIVDLRIFKNRGYTIGVLCTTVLTFALLGSTIMLPLMLQILLGYPAWQSGLAVLPRGIAAFFGTILAGVLVKKMGNQMMCVVGVSVFTSALYLLSRLNLDVGVSDIVFPQILQGAGMTMMFLPLTLIATETVTKEEMGNATSVFNMMRNLGASFGIATSATLLVRRQQLHVNRLGESISSLDAAAEQMLSAIQHGMMSRGVDAVTAAKQAHAVIWGMVQRHATMMSYNDIFFFLTMLCAAMLPVIIIMTRSKRRSRNIATEPVAIEL